MGQLQISTDASDRARLRVRGDGRGADLGPFEKAAVAILNTSSSRLVVDLEGLDAADERLVAALNRIAEHPAALEGNFAVEVPVGCLEWLAEAPLERAVRVERTDAPVRRRAAVASVPPPASRLAPSAGAPRREGPGFVTSYGAGRACAEPGCATTLSRYNNHDRCGVHWLGIGGRR